MNERSSDKDDEQTPVSVARARMNPAKVLAFKSEVNSFAKELAAAAPGWMGTRIEELRELAVAALREQTPHERGALIEKVAIALCKHFYAGRSFDEYVAPGRELWQRLIPEAEIAIQAIFGAPTDKSAKP